jgi:hypothetical protein
MKKKIIITESQLDRLKGNLYENSVHSAMVKQMKEELDSNYEPVAKFVREGGEYFERPMIIVKADKEIITPKSLYEYMKYKYKVNDEFIKQVIRDWVSNKITDDYGLSKNISLKK